jgi:hypothetical protein
MILWNRYNLDAELIQVAGCRLQVAGDKMLNLILLQ